MNIIQIHKYCWRLMTIVSLGAVSCTNDVAFEDIQNRESVAFTAQVNRPSTRITDTSWDGDELIGMKVGTNVKTYTIDTEGAMTTTDTPFQWEGTTYDVLAWTPMTTETIDLKDQSTDERFFDCDFLASNAKVVSKKVRLSFTHRMTRMWWELQATDGFSEDEVNSARISFIGYGSAQYTDGTVTPIGSADQSIATRNSRGEYYRNGEAMMVPCEMWEKPLIKVEIGGNVFIYTPSKQNANDVSKRTGDLLPNTWQRYYLKVSKKALTVTMESTDVDWEHENIDNDWISDAKFRATISDDVLGLPQYTITGLTNSLVDNAETGFTISFEEKGIGGLSCESGCKMKRTVNENIHTYTFTNITSDLRIAYTSEYIVIGDYYYSDGTWGSSENKKDATPLGRVFKLGKHGNDISTYPMEKVRGYVVCTTLEEDLKGKWLFVADADYKIRLDKIDELTDDDRKDETLYSGYTLTKGIEAALEDYASVKTDFPFWHTFCQLQLSAPENTSGWYIPSIAQLKDIKASGVYADGFNKEYWSSNVYAERGEANAVTRIWALDYKAALGNVGTYWSSDERALIIVLTF